MIFFKTFNYEAIKVFYWLKTKHLNLLYKTVEFIFHHTFTDDNFKLLFDFIESDANFFQEFKFNIMIKPANRDMQNIRKLSP